MSIYRKQKLFIIISVVSINLILSLTSILYARFWYVFLIFLAIATTLNAIYSVLLIANLIWNYKTVKSDNKLDEKSIAIVVPCYNETIE